MASKERFHGMIIRVRPHRALIACCSVAISVISFMCSPTDIAPSSSANVNFLAAPAVVLKFSGLNCFRHKF